MYINWKCLWGLLVGLWALPGLIVAQEMLDLNQALGIALENNYAIKIAKTQQQLAQSNFNRGNAGFYPRLTANLTQNFGRTDVRQEFATGSVQQRIGAASNTLIGNLNLNWTLFDGLAMFAAYERLGEQKKITDLNLLQNVETTARNVTVAYFDIIQQQQRLRSFQNNLLISAKRLELAKDRYEIGSGSKIEYLNAQVDYNADRSDIIRQELSIKNSKIRLNRILLRASDTDFSISDSILVNPDLSYNALLEAARSNNLAIRLAKQNRKVSEIQYREVRADRLPTISLNVDYTFTRAASEAGILLRSNNLGLVLGLNASFNIFNGRNQHRLEQNAKINILLNEQQQADLMAELERSVTELFNSYQNSLLLAELEKENLNIALQNVEVALERYKLGVTTFLELREVQRNVIAAENRLIDAIYQAKLAEIELLRLTNNLVRI
ncbi:MAG TPA: TolC family protein [Microscillaceae bacterium]|jgi:outer membrane protein TolC|nr:TolC family protein [Microscillaceae bacterium]